MGRNQEALAFAHAPLRAWFEGAFDEPTPVQRRAWPALARGESTLLVAPTGSGKTLAAFLVLLDRLLFGAEERAERGCRVLYVSPLKALGVDVDRNLRAPLSGIREAAARAGVPCRDVAVGQRTGDTPAKDRARMLRHPPDVLITTPESLYLLLTSRGESILRTVETVVVDEIHAVAGRKRGAHLFLSLERLEALREGRPPLQRIGLSATQHPIAETRRLLGGGDVDEAGVWRPRAVRVIDTGERKALEIRVEHDPAGEGGGSSVWPAIHDRILALVRAHRSTLVFVNSRRLAERIAAAVNERAGQRVACAHHGSIAREARLAIEERLKRGALKCLLATSTLELGIDMGAIDLVVQIEAPPSVAAGLQRIGRSGHGVAATARGVLLPKHKGDLLAAAASVPAMREGRIEATFYPRNALDVLAQQVVAAVAMRSWAEEDLYRWARRAAPYADLPRSAWVGLLDMLSGRYPSHDFEGLRPRVTWDRGTGRLDARVGAHRVAVVNAGTIPDRGLYGVFLDPGGDDGRSHRVGELDEEMVEESRVGDVFLLGASSWRITAISHDRVLVAPMPGEPGRMPFWRGDGPGRPVGLGRAIGALARRLASLKPAAAKALLIREHGFDEGAAEVLVRHVRDQEESGGLVPTDERIVIESFPDEIGDPRIAVLSPFGARVHAPWAAALSARWRRDHGVDLEVVWSDDGMMLRLPPREDALPADRLVPRAADIEELVTSELARLPLYASRFREAAARALLLPRRAPGRRSPLWLQRRRSADLLAFASGFPDFPIVLEAYRECLKDVFDLPALKRLLEDVEAGRVGVATVETPLASPFAASLGFAYTAAFFYESDAPPSERRAHALTVDQALLQELLGEAELRALLDPEAAREVEVDLSRRGARVPLADEDDVHDLLLAQGERSREELGARAADPDRLDAWLASLRAAGRVLAVRLGDRTCWIAVEDAARYRDALGVTLPAELPETWRRPTARPLRDLLLRHARTHGPFAAGDVAARWGVAPRVVEEGLSPLVAEGRLVEGSFRARGRGREVCEAEVLRAIKRRTLAHVRAGVEPVPREALQRFALSWHGIGGACAGPDALAEVLDRLAGAALPASSLDPILRARLAGYRPSDPDALLASGAATWRGLEPLGAADGRIALYPAADAPLLAPPPRPVEGDLAPAVEATLLDRGASFFRDVVRTLGAYPPDVLAALWDLVWAGRVSNDTLAPVRSRLAAASPTARRRSASRPRRGDGPPGSEGRWWAVPPSDASPTEALFRLAERLLDRHGVLTREAVRAEGVPGGLAALLPVLEAMEGARRVQRAYFVERMGARQFALPLAPPRLRGSGARRGPAVLLEATDPALLWGGVLAWPAAAGSPRREAGATVVLRGGHPLAWLSPSGGRLLLFGAAREDPEAARSLARALASLLEDGRRPALLLATIDGGPAGASPLAPAFLEAGFADTPRGLLRRAAGRR
jgi:ATP-dependent Lhr-like helicase